MVNRRIIRNTRRAIFQLFLNNFFVDFPHLIGIIV